MNIFLNVYDFVVSRPYTFRQSLLYHPKKKKKKKRWKEAEAGVVWKWEPHMGDECGSYVSAVEWEGVQGRISEACRVERVYSVGVSLVVCRE